MQQIADQWIEDGNDWGDLAVLVRDNASATGLILELLSRDTPFNLKGNIEFLGNAPYADALLGLLHLLNGSLFNPEQKKRLVSLLRFPYTRIPTKTWEQVADRCIKTYSLEPAIKAVQNAGLHDYATTRQIERLKWLAHSSHTEYRTLTDRFPDGAGGVQAAILQRYIADGVADYKAAFSWMATNEQMADRYARVVKEIIDFVNRIDKPLDELLVQFDSFEEKIRQNDNGITISTCHSAKGLQYDGVVL
ncbi:3'-5' exonuclease, partial [Thiolapillus sp.]